MTYRITKTERIARERMIYHRWLIDVDQMDISEWIDEMAPSAWHTLAEDIDCIEPKEKITLYLDRSVARSFKSMGKGYQARINRLLQSWLQMVAANEVQREKRLAVRMSQILQRSNAAYEDGEETPSFSIGELDWPREDPPEVDW